MSLGLAGTAAADPARPDIRDRDGLVYRWYPPYGYRFQPLASFADLSHTVSAHDEQAARRLALALIRRGVRGRVGLYWQYDFPYGGPVPWRSGFVQAVAAQALVRTYVLLGDGVFFNAASEAFAGLESTLLMPLGGGLWVREYGFSHEAILNAQLESLRSLEIYARIVDTTAVVRLAASVYRATRTMLPSFDLGCRSRYSLSSGPASPHYQAYHVDLLRRLSIAFPDDPVWRTMYLRWRPCAVELR
jgi:D-glucuronyl C5-epimerase-like protein